jgi:hypothetical protein
MWFFRETGLRQQELATGSKLRSAIEETRTLSLVQRSYYLQLINANPRYLNSVNPKARIRWGEMVCEEFSHHFRLGPNKPEPDQRISLVTLCDRRCCTSHEAKNLDIPRFSKYPPAEPGALVLEPLEAAYPCCTSQASHPLCGMPHASPTAEPLQPAVPAICAPLGVA